MSNDSIAPQSHIAGVRAIQLELLAAVDSICRGHRLSYFGIAGTALGAVRHSGFIPWDDDLDLGMERRDFDTFVKIAKQELGPDHFLQHRTTDPQFPLPMVKVRREGSKFVEAATASVAMHQGIFIDIFPIDRKPVGALSHTLHRVFLKASSRAARISCGYKFEFRSRSISVAEGAAGAMLRHIPTTWLSWALETTARAFHRGTGPLTIVGGTYGYDKEFFAPEWLKETTLLPFENTTIPVFSAVEQYLEHLYGDFNALPPVYERESPHNVIQIELPVANHAR